jgi:hypothetical protein
MRGHGDEGSGPDGKGGEDIDERALTAKRGCRVVK